MAYDVSKWLRDNMTQLNLTDEDRAIAERLLSGTLGQRLGASVYPQESVSGLQSQLDRQRADALRTQTEYETANKQWAEFAYGLGAKYNAVAELEAAGFDVSGLRNTPSGGAQNANGQQLTREEITALIAAEAAKAVEPVRQGALDFAEFVATAAPDYREQYGKRFDAKKFREYAFEHRSEFANLSQAYDSFTAEDRSAKAVADQKKWEVDKEKEIELRLMSRMQIPEVGGMGDSGGVFDIAKSAASDAAVPTREQNRQEFANKHINMNLQGL